MRFELTTPTLARLCSTPELRPLGVHAPTDARSSVHMAEAHLDCNREIAFDRPRRASAERPAADFPAMDGLPFRILIRKPTDLGANCPLPEPVTMSDSSEPLFAFLGKLSIDVTTVRHPPLFTVADSQALRGEIPGGHTKNLFLKDKKDNYFLLTVREDADIDLKTIHKVIGAASRVSFGKPDKLMDYLGVLPGAVTAFGVINDTGHKVRIFLDADLMAGDIVNAHPLINDATTSIRRDDLLAFIRATGHEPHILKLTA